MGFLRKEGMMFTLLDRVVGSQGPVLLVAYTVMSETTERGCRSVMKKCVLEDTFTMAALEPLMK